MATVISTSVTLTLTAEISFKMVKLKNLSIASAHTGWTREHGESISQHTVLNTLPAFCCLPGELINSKVSCLVSPGEVAFQCLSLKPSER